MNLTHEQILNIDSKSKNAVELQDQKPRTKKAAQPALLRDSFKGMSKAMAEEIAAEWGEIKLKWNRREIGLSKQGLTTLIEVQKGIHEFHPEFDHLLDFHTR